MDHLSVWDRVYTKNLLKARYEEIRKRPETKAYPLMFLKDKDYSKQEDRKS